jgi:hypothetical protein
MLTLSGWLDERLDQMRYNELFWWAGVNHDNCYHGNPISYGYSKQDCDERFIEDLLAVCLYHEENGAMHWFKPTICRTYASLMFGMVRRHGTESYTTYNLRAVYPEPKPVYQQLGFPENPITDAMKDEVEAMLIKFKIIDASEENPDHS